MKTSRRRKNGSLAPFAVAGLALAAGAVALHNQRTPEASSAAGWKREPLPSGFGKGYRYTRTIDGMKYEIDDEKARYRISLRVGERLERIHPPGTDWGSWPSVAEAQRAAEDDARFHVRKNPRHRNPHKRRVSTAVLGERVRVFRNLHTQTWSMESATTGRIIAHPDTVLLEDVRLVSRDAGREETRRTGAKNVHAVATGTLVAIDGPPPADLHRWTPLYYNPFKVDTFVEFMDGKVGKPVRGSRMWFAAADHRSQYALAPQEADPGRYRPRRKNPDTLPTATETKRRLQRILDQENLPPDANLEVLHADLDGWHDEHDNKMQYALDYVLGGYTNLDRSSILEHYRDHELHRLLTEALGIPRGDEEGLLENTEVMRYSDSRDRRVLETSYPGLSVFWSGTLYGDGEGGGALAPLLREARENPRRSVPRRSVPRRSNGLLGTLALVGIGFAAGVYVEEKKGVAEKVRRALKGKDKTAREQFDRLKRTVLEAQPARREAPRAQLALRTSAPITVRSSILQGVTDPAWVRERSPDDKGYSHTRRIAGTEYVVFERIYDNGDKAVILDALDASGRNARRIPGGVGLLNEEWKNVATAKKAAEKHAQVSAA